MIEKGFSFNGKHLTEDFQCYIKESTVSPPKKIMKQITVPYKNGSYSVGNLYGEPVFENRKITYIVDIAEGSIVNNNELKTRIQNWLLLAERGRLVDDAFPGYYFIAECITVTERNEDEASEIEIIFDADPYRVRITSEGEVEWDTFYFETDYLQECDYEINGTRPVTLYNPGSHMITPTITCSAPITVQDGKRTYSWLAGTHTDYRLTLKPGVNQIMITGEAIVNIEYHAEVL